jgi:hypothetical protein
MKELTIIEEFPINIQDFFQLFIISDNFKKKYHEKRKYFDLVIPPWEKNSENSFKRTIQFKTPITNNSIITKIVGSYVEIIDNQTYKYLENNEILLETNSKVLGTLSDYFNSYIKWIIKPKDLKTTIVHVIVDNQCRSLPFWLKSFQGTFENFIYDSAKNAMNIYLELAKETIENYNEEKKKIENNVIENSKVSLSSSMLNSEIQENILKDEEEKKKTSFENSLIENSSDSEVEYFDAENEHLFSPKNSITKFMENMKNEMENLKNMIERTHTRLLGLELAFLNLQEKYIPITNKSNSIQENIQKYFERLDIITQQKIEEEKKEKEKENIFHEKLNDLNEKINSLHNSSTSSIIPINKNFIIIGFLFFWPWIFNTLFKFTKFFGL